MGTGWFVGRASELEQLQGLIAGLADGVGGVALVAGEQGIGKTALLRQAVAAASGCRVCWGAADESGQRFPLLLMLECLGQEARLAVHGRPIAERGLGPVPSGDPVLAAVERLLALVDRMCAASPVVVVAEDLQWADQVSLLAWRRLALAARQMPLLVVGSFRPAPTGGEVGRLRQSVAESNGVVVDLQPLPLGEVAALAGGLLGARPGRALEALLGRAGGNPLYVRELVDALARDGRVALAGEVAELAGDPAAVRVPVSLEAAISGRLGGLPSAAMELLRWAAVLGPEFSVTDLAAVTERSAGELWAVIDQAVAAGVVSAQQGPRLRFRHGLIRQVLYEGIPRSVREALHLEAARALAEAGAEPRRVAAQLVAAPEGVGGWEREWVWEWLAGAEGVLAYQAPVVAAELLRRALERMPAGDGRRGRLEAGLVRVAFLLMLNGEVEQVARPMLARTADPERAAEASWLLGYALSRTGRHDEAMEVVDAALARPGLGGVWAARLGARQAMTQLIAGRVDQAAELAERVLADADKAQDRFAAGYALHTLSMVAYYQRDWAGSLDRIERALAVIGDNPQTTDLRLLLLSNLASTLADLDRHGEAGPVLREALSLAERAGTPRLGTVCAAAAGNSYEAGQWDDALAMLETAAGLPGADEVPILVHGLAALIAACRDDREMVEAHLAAVGEAWISDPAHRESASWLFLAQALAAEQEGHADRVAAVLAQCLDPGFAAIMPFRDRLLPALARVAVVAGDTVSAATAARAAAAAADREPTPFSAIAADHCRGLVDDDPEPVLVAAAYYESAGRPADQAGALEDAAAVLALRGDLPAARQAFTSAASLYRSLEAKWNLRRMEARLSPFGIRLSPTGRRARPDLGWEALTHTEAKIARLVGDGRSNPDIAAELFLSRNTVQTHVSHILAKLGARSRAEVMRQVLGRAGRQPVG